MFGSILRTFISFKNDYAVLALPYFHRFFNIMMCIFTSCLKSWTSCFWFYWKLEQVYWGRIYRACWEEKWSVRDVVFVSLKSSMLSKALAACRVNPVKTRHYSIVKKAKGDLGWGFVGLFRQSIAMQRWVDEPWSWCHWGVTKRKVEGGLLVGEKRARFGSIAWGGEGGFGDGVEAGRVPWRGNGLAVGGWRIWAAMVEALLLAVGCGRSIADLTGTLFLQSSRDSCLCWRCCSGAHGELHCQVSRDGCLVTNGCRKYPKVVKGCGLGEREKDGGSSRNLNLKYICILLSK